MTNALELDLLDGSWYAGGSHAIWEQLRREAPVHHDPSTPVGGS